MSVGHLDYQDQVRSKRQIYEVLGQGDTPRLLNRGYAIDCGHDVPYVGGASVDRRTIFLDRRAVQEVKDGTIRVIGMSPRDVIQGWVIHEFHEKCVVDG